MTTEYLSLDGVDKLLISEVTGGYFKLGVTAPVYAETPTNEMRIINPVTVTDAVLTSSDIPEDDYTEWSAVTAYLVGDTVTVSDSGVHSNYECLINNTNKYPPDYTGGASPEWLDLGKNNRWRMFDTKVGNVSSQAAAITVELTPGAVINSVALFELAGSTVNLTLSDPLEGIVYDESVAITESPYVEDWYTYFFSDFETTTEIVKTNLPSYPSAALTVEILSDATAQCGQCVIGKVKKLGITQFGTSVGILDYSRKETDDFGNNIIVQRNYAQTVNYQAEVQSNRVRDVQRTLAAIRTSPVVWIGSEDYPSTIVYGWYKDFSIVINTACISQCNLEVEEFR
jgi:hypothetical protein